MVYVSVIIPVYNAEKYLPACITSLLNQTIQEIEFIFVNDGSTDNSQSLLEMYQQSDSRIILINQDNQGVSVARNNGMAIAQGDYIGFVDADDTITPEYYHKLFTAALDNRTDIVFSNFIQELDGLHIQFKLPFPAGVALKKDYIETTLLPYMFAEDGLNTCCTKLYKRELLHQNAVHFPQGIALGEDGFFNLQAFHYATSVMYLDFSGYFYREVTGSATRNLLEKDYFQRALQVYQFDIKKVIPLSVSDKVLQKQKSIRLANKVVSYTFIYLKPSNGLPFIKKYKYVRAMLRNASVKGIFNNEWLTLKQAKSMFQKITLYCIKYQQVCLLFILTYYSYRRNK